MTMFSEIRFAGVDTHVTVQSTCACPGLLQACLTRSAGPQGPALVPPSPRVLSGSWRGRGRGALVCRGGPSPRCQPPHSGRAQAPSVLGWEQTEQGEALASPPTSTVSPRQTHSTNSGKTNGR